MANQKTITCGLPHYENTVLSKLRDGMAKEEIADCYDSFAEDYDEEVKKRDYAGPRVCAEAVAKCLGDKKGSRILDVASGTGLCGEELRKLGFTSLDALDCSQRSLDFAKSKNRYNRYICDFIGTNRLDIEDGYYDAVACCGSFIPAALKTDCLPELIRLVKPGGFIGITTREAYLTTASEYSDGKLEAAMMELQTRGSWERVSREIAPGYLQGVDAVTFVFRVLRLI